MSDTEPGPVFVEEHVDTAVPAPEPLELTEDGSYHLKFSLDDGYTPELHRMGGGRDRRRTADR